MVIFGVPTRTLAAEILTINKFSGASGGYSRVRNEKIYRAKSSKLKSHEGIQSRNDFCRSLRISVLSSLLMQNHLWRKENYSSRYLLYESYQVGGNPWTLVLEVLIAACRAIKTVGVKQPMLRSTTSTRGKLAKSAQLTVAKNDSKRNFRSLWVSQAVPRWKEMGLDHLRVSIGLIRSQKIVFS